MALLNNRNESLNIRLGSDVTMPIVGDFEPISGINLLLQDIQILLLTVPGERVNRPTFGCNLRNLIWENMSTASIEGAAEIRSALENFEPRIKVLNVSSQVNENTGLISFNIQFLINGTDSILNLIFPFRVGTTLSFA